MGLFFVRTLFAHLGIILSVSAYSNTWKCFNMFNRGGKVLEKIDFKGLKDFLLSLQLMLVMSISTGVILFSPNEISEMMFLEEIKKRFGYIISFMFIISVSVILVVVAYSLFFKIKEKCEIVKYETLKSKRISKYTKQEKDIIMQFTKIKGAPILLPSLNGTVQKLINDCVIRPAANCYNTKSNNPHFPYLLELWVYEYLDANPNYLDENL